MAAETPELIGAMTGSEVGVQGAAGARSGVTSTSNPANT